MQSSNVSHKQRARKWNRQEEEKRNKKQNKKSPFEKERRL